MAFDEIKAAAHGAAQTAADAEDGVRASKPYGALLKPGDVDCYGDTVGRIYVQNETAQVYLGAALDAGARPANPAEAVARAEGPILRFAAREGVADPSEIRGRVAPLLDHLLGLCDAVASIRPISKRGEAAKAALAQRVNKVIARAIGFAADGCASEARDLIDQLRDEVHHRRDSSNRMRYVLVNLLSLMFFSVALLALGPVWLDAAIGFEVAGQSIGAKMLALGALGAFFSVAINLPRLTVNHALGVYEMIYAGFVRIPIGLIAASVVILMIGGEWLFPGESNPATAYTAMLTAFVAGFSESFVPNALGRVAQSGERRPR